MFRFITTTFVLFGKNVYATGKNEFIFSTCWIMY